VQAGDATIAEIGIGLLVLVAIERGDTEFQAERLLAHLAAGRARAGRRTDLWLNNSV
jgi:D-Tyr-tRNAtyr deacylase